MIIKSFLSVQYQIFQTLRDGHVLKSAILKLMQYFSQMRTDFCRFHRLIRGSDSQESKCSSSEKWDPPANVHMWDMYVWMTIDSFQFSLLTLKNVACSTNCIQAQLDAVICYKRTESLEFPALSLLSSSHFKRKIIICLKFCFTVHRLQTHEHPLLVHIKNSLMKVWNSLKSF